MRRFVVLLTLCLCALITVVGARVAGFPDPAMAPRPTEDQRRAMEDLTFTLRIADTKAERSLDAANFPYQGHALSDHVQEVTVGGIDHGTEDGQGARRFSHGEARPVLSSQTILLVGRIRYSPGNAAPDQRPLRQRSRATVIIPAHRVIDGGLATELARHGHDLSDHLWSARLLLDAPEAIEDVHAAYFRAGADVAAVAVDGSTYPVIDIPDEDSNAWVAPLGGFPTALGADGTPLDDHASADVVPSDEFCNTATQVISGQISLGVVQNVGLLRDDPELSEHQRRLIAVGLNHALTQYQARTWDNAMLVEAVNQVCNLALDPATVTP